MEKVVLNNVRIGVLNNNGNFTMTTFVDNLKMYFQDIKPENIKYSPKVEILGYEILSDSKVNLFCSDEKAYVINSFSDEYIEYLTRLHLTLTEVIKKCNQKNRVFLTGCKIYNLNLVAKINGNEMFLPPIKGLKIHGFGNIVGHKYLKNTFGKTSKIVGVNSASCTLSSKRTIYEIASLSIEYEKYLLDILFEVEVILKQYSI